jgi:thiol-disulfide isomerase/thioredoxin
VRPAAVAGIGLAWLASCSADAGSGDGVGVGPARASIEAVDLDGLAKAIEGYRGAPLLVNFWAMWCVPCVQELPELAAVRKELRANGGEVLGVAMDLTAEGYTHEGVLAKLPEFLRKSRIDYPNVLYGDTDPFPVIERFRLPGPIPVTLAFDRRGQRVAMHEGRATLDELRELAAAAAR